MAGLPHTQVVTVPLPVGLQTVTVTGTRYLPDGTPDSGTILFTPEPDILTSAGTGAMIDGTATAQLAADGSFSTTVLATDSTGITPSGWTYRVLEQLTSGTRAYPIALPAAAPTVKLAAIAPTAPAVGQYVVVTGPQGPAGATGATGPQGPQPPLGSAGAGATIALVSTDPTTTNSRTPTAHAASHATGGSDPLTSAAIGAALSSDLPYPQAAYSSNRRLPQWRQPATVITTFQSGHGWTNNAGSTIVTNDTADFILGTQACKLTSGGAGASANLSKLAMASFDTTGKAIRLRLKIDDITHMTGLNFFLGSSSLANTYKWIIQGGVAGSNFVTSGDWLTVTLNWHDATTTGTPARNAITDARLQIVDDATATVTLHANSVELIADASATFPNGVVSVTFDDSYQSVWDYAMPKMAAYGYPASVYTIQDLIGGSGRFTFTELRALQDLHGWETASHANTDSDHSLTYTGMTAAALDADLRALKAWGDAQGFRGSGGTAYPLGQYGKTTDNVSTTDIVRRYFDYARTTTSKTKETFPPADPFRLRAISSISTFTGGYAPATLTTASTGDLDKAKANQSWLILVFHKITTGAPAALTECSQADFNSIIDNINSRGMPVLPIGDVLRYYA